MCVKANGSSARAFRSWEPSKLTADDSKVGQDSMQPGHKLLYDGIVYLLDNAVSGGRYSCQFDHQDP